MKMTETTKLRVEKAVRSRLSLPNETAEQVPPLLGEFILQEGMIHSGKDRIDLTKDAKDKIAYVNRCLSWMSDQEKHHGQQATEIAEKTQRGLRRGTLTGKDLIAMCEEFHRVRRKHILRAAGKKSRAEEWTVSLSDGLTARRLTTEKDLDTVGKHLKNCFANKFHVKEAKRQLRKGETGFVVIQSETGKPIVLLSFDRESNRLLEVKGVENARPIKYRDAIIETLRRLGCEVGECADALEMAICDGLLDSTDGKIKRFKIDGWRCDIGRGFCAMTFGDCSILLGSNGYRRCGTKLIEVAPQSDVTLEDFEALPNRRFHDEETTIRVWLRESCRVRLSFARACYRAFQDAPDLFVWDWFGHGHGRPAPRLILSMI
jgi:hypothetical protein